MPDDHTYNGWTNYETWNVNLWLDNEEPSYRRVLELVKLAKKRPSAQRATNLAKRLRAEITYNGRKFRFGDLLTREEMARVNWREIAEYWLED